MLKKEKNNLLLLFTTLVGIVASIIEAFIGVSSAQVWINFVLLIIYAVPIIIFIKSKEKNKLLYIFVALLIVGAIIDMAQFGSVVFKFTTPKNYRKLIFSNPLFYKINHYVNQEVKNTIYIVSITFIVSVCLFIFNIVNIIKNKISGNTIKSN